MTIIRETDSEARYADLMIMEGSLWRIYIHEDQRYLGRCYIWSTREGHLHLRDTTTAEWDNLHEYMSKLEQTLIALFQPDKFNEAVLGNISARVHMHVIPRYIAPREWQGITFVDGRWNQNCFPYEKFRVDRHILHALRDCIKEAL